MGWQKERKKKRTIEVPEKDQKAERSAANCHAKMPGFEDCIEVTSSYSQLYFVVTTQLT